VRFAEIFKTELFSKYGQKAGCYINEIYDIMYAGSEKCRHIRNSSRLFTGRKGNTHGKKSSDQVFHETIHAVPGF
jgi:hypothetical protein